jgi:hypothetical protein
MAPLCMHGLVGCWCLDGVFTVCNCVVVWIDVAVVLSMLSYSMIISRGGHCCGHIGSVFKE